jgi:hypothetical protein
MSWRGAATPTGALLVAACVLALAGCRKPVFSTTEDRSQFERFDVSRDERAEPFIEDEYGRKVPNLRGRLVR